MAKKAPQEVLDAPLDVIADSDAMFLCSAEPTSYSEASSTYALAEASMSSGDFSKGAGDVSGRKITIGAKSNIDVDASGDATHVVLVKKSDSKIRYITTCEEQAVTEGNTVSIQSWKVEFQQAS